ncbi:hypothetical protein K493DRAFT_291733 [Basidiobolus meristosporus CBS 931.73]|uniref:PH domain-containing protein n=1 Tax=Basidiobolus meristosporus CBS 931.73 TaxID=1314790 RepID=A0A1Y1XG99_9FUNG|nr:hypothetical protein K493DRAFT_291733 [Basidiobolus meristosporus CBS 931.73]|eukprot:ORX84788.1 hypothetical protein K493DRAFT_291733 [Basidiobolus meristosporus CBS 931.73]
MLIEFRPSGNLEAIRTIVSSCVATSPSNNVFPLHMAAGSANKAITEFILSLTEVDVNQQDHSGNTALHISASLGRVEIVKLLLKHHDIDDTIVNRDGKQPHHVAVSGEVLRLLEQSRHEFMEKRNSDILRFLSSSNIRSFIQVFLDNRARSLLDINLSESENGFSALHIAAMLNDAESVQALLKMGVDVYIRDHKEHLPIDLTKCPNIRTILKQAMNTSQVIIHSPGKTLSGFLQKWTNYAGGYKTRWFVLENGVLSYYMNQTQAKDACRGAVNVRSASITIHKQDNSRFDIIGPQSTKYYLRANHPVEAKRWVLALNQAKSSLEHGENIPEGSTLSRSPYILPNSPCFPYTPDQSPTNSIFGIPPASPALKLTFERRLSSLGTQQVDLDSSDEDSEDPEKLPSWKITSAITELISQQLHIAQALEELSTECDKKDAIQKALLSANRLAESASRSLREQERYWKGKYLRQSQQYGLWVENFKHLAYENHALQRDIELGKARFPSIAEINEKELEAEEEQDDEFYDAVDYEVPSDSFVPTEFYSEREKRAKIIATSYKGYPKDLRTQLPIQSLSGKPDLSLWSVLANSIGKDLTRIALPVYFNEPTSMLQRLCEEMEYSELADMAAQHSDSLHRLLWVAAFAMTNYSGSEHRIAKPFNPLLGETFEYVRPDKGYRYISEQVSHHPPISACYCESPNFEFYAEVDCKTKFYGKSFELFPAGLTHLHLKIPRKFVEKEEQTDRANPPDSQAVLEHFSWKKVTTRVNNILIGKIYLENYGDMEIINHRTGEMCILSFKERRWGSSEKNLVEGVVKDKHGKPIWRLHGKWSEFLAARMIDGSTEPFPGDKQIKCKEIVPIPIVYNRCVETTNPVVLLWKKKKGLTGEIPFNLTPFAITLNDCPETLIHYLAPTDSRLRPDQKALERGEYEIAQKEKMRLEEKQRVKRKENEQDPNFTWSPRWFVRDYDPDSQKGYWRFTHQYWEVREKSGQTDPCKESTAWRNTLDIF